MSRGLDNIDKIFKDAFDGFEANVDPSVWTNVQSSIGGGASGATNVTPKMNPSAVASGGMKALVAKIVIGVAVVGTVGTAGYFVAESLTEPNEAISENVLTEDFNKENTATTEIIPATEESLEKESVSTIATAEESSSAKEEKGEVTSTTVNDNNNTPKEENVAAQVEENSNPAEKSINQTTDESSTNHEENSTTDATTDKVTTEESKEEIVEESKEESVLETVATPKEESKTIEAQVDVIPNVITPNGDGKNDIIKITGVNLKKIEVVIMDKTGKPVYRIQSIEEEWNGKDQNGYDLIPGIYYLAGVVVDEDGNTKNIKQTVNLLP